MALCPQAKVGRQRTEPLRLAGDDAGEEWTVRIAAGITPRGRGQQPRLQ